MNTRNCLRVAQLIGVASWLGIAACSSGGGGAMIGALAADAAGVDDLERDESPAVKRDAGKTRDSAPSEPTDEVDGVEEDAGAGPDGGRDAAKDASAKDAAKDAAKESGGFDASAGFDAGGGVPIESCVTATSGCKVGGEVQVCTTSTSTSATCIGMRYLHDGKSYNCTGCTSCDAAWSDAYVTCMNAKYGCDDLESCCAAFPSASQSGCYSAVTSYRAQLAGDVQCKSTYESYVNAGYCN